MRRIVLEEFTGHWYLACYFRRGNRWRLEHSQTCDTLLAAGEAARKWIDEGPR